VGVAVDDDVAEEVEQLGRAVAPRLERNSSGVVSISVVVAWPAAELRVAMTFSRNGMFVLTPRIRNSRARGARGSSRSRSLAAGDAFTSSES
jgi:hypothetical protein